ncbi:MAG: UDP-N-acetylmuramate--L-alanine ligase [Candidatus Liptonbacteria bacterium]|nr:UDP-N-acetylmuramate--L-alanine ligase [Candidatus Liptonbacteria bacterium]
MTSLKSIHFIGIGGIGMSSLARYFLALNRVEGKAQKRAVSGSDIAESGITRKLRKEGVKVQIGHKKGHISGQMGLVVYSQAIKPDNPELKEARRLGIRAISYPEAVGELTEKYTTIAVSGAHGKSTTTAIAGLILKKAGLDPTIIVGTELKQLSDSNFRMGRSQYLVLEADEFGRAFHHYSPAVAVITNIDREHLDVYKNLAGAQKAFLKFMDRVRGGGTLILNKDDAPLASLAAKIKKIARNHKLKVIWYSVHGNTAKKIARVIKVPGIHNISNAVAAYKAGRMLGAPHKKILSAIGEYQGASRRFEYRGNTRFMVHGSWIKALIYDDYAHHPTEIRATLQAFREKFPRSPLVCVFQPHQAKRLAALFKEFQSAFAIADITLILPIYKVTGRDFSLSSRRKPGSSSRFTSETLVRAMQKNQPEKLIFYLESPKHLKSALKTLLSSSFESRTSNLNPPVIIMMGAGDIVDYTKSLVNEQQKRR